MASTFAFAQDHPEHLHDAPLTSIDGDAMAPDQSSTEDEDLQNEPSEDPQTELEEPVPIEEQHNLSPLQQEGNDSMD